jgi:hypothetical protein
MGIVESWIQAVDLNFVLLFTYIDFLNRGLMITQQTTHTGITDF